MSLADTVEKNCYAFPLLFFDTIILSTTRITHFISRSASDKAPFLTSWPMLGQWWSRTKVNDRLSNEWLNFFDGIYTAYTLIFIQEGYIQEGQPQFGQKIKKFIYMMTSLLLNKGLRLNSDSNLLIYKKECSTHYDN